MKISDRSLAWRLRNQHHETIEHYVEELRRRAGVIRLHVRRATSGICAICCIAIYINMHSNPHGSEVIMPSPLNIRDIGQDRKAALELEAKATGNSFAEVVRDWIDAGIARSRAERDRAAWIASAKAGIADESCHLEQNGPSLARFRQV